MRVCVCACVNSCVGSCNGIACFNTLIIYQHKQLVIFRMFNTTELSIYTCLLFLTLALTGSLLAAPTTLYAN